MNQHLQQEMPPSRAEAERIELAVQTRLFGRVQEFRVDAGERGLILRGLASTYHGKQLAQHLVMSVTLLPIAANEIEVL